MQFFKGALIFLLVLGTARAQELKPWALRDHLTFGGHGMSLDYDVEDGFWRVKRANGDVVADNLAWSIELADGTTITPRDVDAAELIRDGFTLPALGKGTYYTSVFPVTHGLRIRSRVSKFDTQPFLAMRISLENTTDAPIEVKRIVAVSAGPGAITPLTPGVQVRARHIVSRGGFPLYDAAAPPLGLQFHDPANGTTFAMGVLPEAGKSTPAVDFKPYENSWIGDIRCDYAPSARIAPGKTLDADTVGVSYGVPKTGHVDLFYSWAFSALTRPESEAERPPSWVTVPESAGIGELVSTGNTWKSGGVRHALIPMGWESVPGSQQGAAPRYPRNMSAAAAQLSQAGLTPGITIDPLAMENERAGGAAKTSDGRWWANPATPQGKEAIGRAAGALAKDGFAFLVVTHSMIPDVALHEFGLSRVEADNLAMMAVQQGAPRAAVLPASAGKLGLQRDAWLEAAASVSRMARFGANPGPVTISTDGLAKLDNETAVAISLWPGPVEILGTPKRNVMATLASVFHAGRVVAQPVDAGLQSPKLWHMVHTNLRTKAKSSNMVLFEGAGNWDPGDLDPESVSPSSMHQASAGPIPAAGNYRAAAASSEDERNAKRKRRR